MSKKCLVIGGGFAGLAAASFLADKKNNTTLLEASPKLGGRAYSFTDTKSNTVIDNGQHILMGCYFNTLNFLELISAKENFEFQDKLKVTFVKKNFQVVPLKAASGFYPINLLLGLLNFNAIKFSERLKLLNVFLKLPFIHSDKLKTKTVEDWLKEENQNENLLNAFWKILAVGALNTSLSKASAKIFVDILKQIFLKGNSAAAIILPKYGLTESYCHNAKIFIEKYNGIIKLSEKVTAFNINNNKIEKIITDKNVYDDFDYVVSTVPAHSLKKIMAGSNFIDIPGLKYSSILNVHLWLNENPFKEKFYGLIDSKVHWVFNKSTYINVVISDADELIEKPDDEIIKLISSELEKFLKLKSSNISGYKIIKEKRATFVPSSEVISKRPKQKTSIKNLILAGDWVNTGLPSTIESAVKSGITAAEIVTGKND